MGRTNDAVSSLVASHFRVKHTLLQDSIDRRHQVDRVKVKYSIKHRHQKLHVNSLTPKITTTTIVTTSIAKTAAKASEKFKKILLLHHQSDSRFILKDIK